MPLSRLCLLGVLCFSAPTPLESQSWLEWDSVQVVPYPSVYPDADLPMAPVIEDSARSESAFRTYSQLLRSASTAHKRNGKGFTIFAPNIRTLWNSDLPTAGDEAAVWAGRGLSMEVGAGFALDFGPLSFTVAPRLTHSENESIDVLQVMPYYPPDLYPPYIPLWYRDGIGVDLPIRRGEDAQTNLTPGESSVSLRLGELTVGGGTQGNWWGPGIRNAIVMSTNAPGFPHVFARPTTPMLTPVGVIDGLWLLGSLKTSPYFGRAEGADDRAIGAFALTLRPAPVPDLTLGFTRALYGPVNEEYSAFSVGHGVLTRWRGIRSVHVEGREPHDQLFSLFGRWALPEAGAEIYAEWARAEVPSSIRDLLLHPNHSQGYTVGLQWGRQAASGLFRVQGEITNLEMATSFRTGRSTSFYVSFAGAQGYTNDGRVIGASIGPGASSQWLAADYFRRDWNLGGFFSRTRWDNDAFYGAPWAQLWGVPYMGHDVSVMTGLRGGYERGGFRIGAEYGVERRMNYLFQNWAVDWGSAAVHSVNVINHRLRLYFSPGASL